MPPSNHIRPYLTLESLLVSQDSAPTRRDVIRHMAYLVGGLAASTTVLTPFNVAASDRLALTDPAGSGSTGTVPADDPTLVAGDILFPSDGATITAYAARPVNVRREGGLSLVLICHEEHGLTDDIRQITRRLAKADYLAVAVDLVSREGGTAAHDSRDIPDLLHHADSHQHIADLRAVVTHFETDHAVDTSQLGVVGFCFGGGLTWRAAIEIPELKAAVPWCGPPPPLENIPDIKAAVLGIYSEDPEDVVNLKGDQLATALTAAGSEHEIRIYPGTRHAFYDDADRHYNEDQAIIAWGDMIEWFGKHLGIAD